MPCPAYTVARPSVRSSRSASCREPTPRRLLALEKLFDRPRSIHKTLRLKHSRRILKIVELERFEVVVGQTA